MTGDTAEQSQPLDADILCTGFGPATGGFLITLARLLATPEGAQIESRAMPGLPPQIICYERADGVGFGVSGVVTRGRAIRASLPLFNPAEVPLCAPVSTERTVYLLDPTGASRRPALMRLADRLLRGAGGLLGVRHEAFELPWTPGFLRKHDGFVAGLGQFNEWVGQQVMASGLVQLWPGTPVAGPLMENGVVAGLRLAAGDAEVRAGLTVVGDGPVGAVSRSLDEIIGMPPGHERDEWAAGMKMVVELPDGVDLAPGTVIHTIGFPEPEIFGFFYVHPGRLASAGIFVPSWFRNPARTAYRYLQHFLLHPYIWRYVQGGRLRSWGAKSLLESGRHGEPYLAGHGYARIGECSGSTNVLTGSGVDEAWFTGTLLAEAVFELLAEGKQFTRENLESTYVTRRRASWLEKESRVAERARDGFHSGVLAGFASMALTGLSGGLLSLPWLRRPRRTATIGEYYGPRIGKERLDKIRADCHARGVPLHDALMDACGWPAIPHDGRLLMSHQDALLLGGKVQAPAGVEDHVVFLQPELCDSCGAQLCVEMCSGEAIHKGSAGAPAFDREKCVHCGACLWNCNVEVTRGRGNIAFAAGPGGLHSAEN